MRRALWYFLRLGVLIAAAVWVAQRPGVLNLDWQGYLVSLPLWLAALGLVVLVALVYLLTRLLVVVRSGPGWWRNRRAQRRRDRGYQALTQGLVAVAAGDPRTAARLAAKAESLLRDPPLTLLLSAQAAQLNGDEGAARRYFEAMLKRPDMAFLGLRGLLTQAMKGGEYARALTLAEQASGLQPKAEWPLKTLLSLQARHGRWADAARSLERLRGLKTLPPDRQRHGQAALLVERSRQVAAQGQAALALSLAQQAHDLAPALVPAAVQLATLASASGDIRGARRTLAQAWRAQPHPDLAALWRDLGADAAAPENTALARVQRLEALVKLDEDSGRPPAREGRLALAEACLDARLWGLARAQLDRLLADGPSVGAYRLLARLEAAEPGTTRTLAADAKGGDAKGTSTGGTDTGGEAQRWWSLMARAPADPAWICGDCGESAPVWSVVCPSCGGFDTLAWGTAAKNSAAATAKALPAPSRFRRLLSSATHLPGRRP